MYKKNDLLKVFPVLDNFGAKCCIIWQLSFENNLNFFSYYLEPTESLFKDLKILAFKKLVIQRILLMMFKHNIGIVPKPISSLFTKKSEIHNYNTRHSSSLHPAIGKSEATYRTFTYHAILIWNYLSKLICTNATLACFKKRSLVYLQTHLIPYRTVR